MGGKKSKSKRKVDNEIDNVVAEIPVTEESLAVISRQLQGIAEGIVKIGKEIESHTRILKDIRDGKINQEPK